MIVSASYRTDIPAFYGAWFLNRFRAGFARVVNPYGGPPSTVPLRAGVDGFVFWTRNIGPFRPALAEVRRAGLPFVVQYTVTGYPRALETSVVEAARSVALVRQVAAEYGPHAAVWRYDPIVVTDLTPAAFHRDSFARLADELAGAVDEVVISFATLYRKTARNLAAAARARHFGWSDPPAEAKRALAGALAGLAAERGLRLGLCAQPDHLVPGTSAAACVDSGRLAAVAGDWGVRPPARVRQKGNRPGCLCAESRDVGAYESCPHGCVYCYAVQTRCRAKARFAAHDPDGEFLIPPG